jgi:hypothetical protein
MKTKLLVVTAALIGAASLSANAGVFFSVNFPVPVVRVTAFAPAPVVVTAPAPVVYTTPTVVVATPPCPAPGYVWAPGYYGPGRVWVAGCWHPGPTHYVYAHPYYGHPYGWHR